MNMMAEAELIWLYCILQGEFSLQVTLNWNPVPGWKTRGTCFFVEHPVQLRSGLKGKQMWPLATEIIVCPRLLWIIFVTLALLSRRLSKYDDTTSSLRNPEARVHLVVILNHYKSFSFSARLSWIKAFKLASNICLGHSPLWMFWKMIG